MVSPQSADEVGISDNGLSDEDEGKQEKEGICREDLVEMGVEEEEEEWDKDEQGEGVDGVGGVGDRQLVLSPSLHHMHHDVPGGEGGGPGIEIRLVELFNRGVHFCCLFVCLLLL